MFVSLTNSDICTIHVKKSTKLAKTKKKNWKRKTQETPTQETQSKPHLNDCLEIVYLTEIENFLL